GYISAMHDALGAGENDVQTVIVLRHLAVVMFLNDAMWSKYDLGKLRAVKVEGTDRWSTKNPFARQLASHGHIVLGCDLATRNLSARLASQVNRDSVAVYEELKANTVGGVILQPTGVYACLRAQEAGCAFFKST